MSQYANDSTVILDGSNNSLLEALKTLDVFESMSGQKINEDKTNVVYIGSLCNKKATRGVTSKNLNWVDDGKFSFSSGYIFNKSTAMFGLNYNKVMTLVKTSIQHWFKRMLTVLGRITIVQSIINSTTILQIIID